MTENKSFIDRLTNVIGDESVNSFAQKCGISESVFRKYLSGSKPGLDNLIKISNHKNINIHWLATGEGHPNGEPYYSMHDTNELTQAKNAYADNLKYNFKKEDLNSELVSVPTLNVNASAGHGAIVYEEKVKGYIGFNPAWLNSNFGIPVNRLFSISSVGDSMEPTINAGEMLLVSRAEEHMTPGDGIYIIRLEGDILVKRLQRLPGSKLKISSDNTIYGSYEIKLDEGTEFEVLGKVILVHGVRKV